MSFARAESPTTLFILDASGSMHAKVEGQPKMEVARKVLNDVVKGLEPDVKLGLVAYGHHSKDDCKDIEVIAPVGTDRAAILKAVNGLQPKGKTPITQAIRLAAGELKEKEGSASIVLVSDGKETCEGDPCAAAKDAVAAGVHLRIHVIGFDVTPEEAEQLKCVAKEGNGKYFSASNAKELSSALVEVSKAPTPEPTEVPPTPAPQAAAPKENILPRGGHGHADAVALAPGDYTMNWKLEANVYEFWRVELKPGQLIRVDMHPSPKQGYLGGVIDGPDKKDLTHESCSNRDATLSWLTSSKRGAAPFYLGLGSCNGVDTGTTLTLAVEDKFDAGTGTDVADEFDKAHEITPGKYEGFLKGDHGDDEKDMYRLKSVDAEKKIQVKVTPPSDASYNIFLYDQDRTIVGEKRSSNPGAISRASWSTTEAQEEVFITIESHHAAQNSGAQGYALEVSVGP